MPTLALSSRLRWVYVMLATSVLGCGGARSFPLRDPVTVDPDRRPFSGKPEEYYSALHWDAIDKSVFRPISRVFAVDPAGEAVNVNSLDEVPDSSWFQNRIGLGRMPLEAVARGGCHTPSPEDDQPWTVTGGKPDGANPGFMIKTAAGRRYLVKFDGRVQPKRATSADVIGALVYHAAGFNVPCNRIVFFDPSALRIDSDAKAERWDGREEPFTARHLQDITEQGARTGDGRVRASASLLLDGEPLGPWTYEGVRSDDPNDVVPHEDRRELRGSYVLAAWLDHYDAREQNTLAMWIPVGGGRGYVRHAFIDWGDCLGDLWSPPVMAPRSGHTYYFDFGQIAADYVTFGAVRRPWEGARFGPAGKSFGYFDSRRFDPSAWKPHYPNPAFVRRTAADVGWMARILARFDARVVETIVAQARLEDPGVQSRLIGVLRERQAKLLASAFAEQPAFGTPSVHGREVCVDDLRVASGFWGRPPHGYRATVVADESEPRLVPVSAEQATVCVRLDTAPNSYTVLSLRADAAQRMDIHLQGLPGGNLRVLGVER